MVRETSVRTDQGCTRISGLMSKKFRFPNFSKKKIFKSRCRGWCGLKCSIIQAMTSLHNFSILFRSEEISVQQKPALRGGVVLFFPLTNTESLWDAKMILHSCIIRQTPTQRVPSHYDNNNDEQLQGSRILSEHLSETILHRTSIKSINRFKGYRHLRSLEPPPPPPHRVYLFHYFCTFCC